MSDETRLEAIVREILELGPDTDLGSLRYRETETWDSVAHLQLLVAIETAFEISIDGAGACDAFDYAGLQRLVARGAG
jgi:acyl carrier protein